MIRWPWKRRRCGYDYPERGRPFLRPAVKAAWPGTVPETVDVVLPQVPGAIGYAVKVDPSPEGFPHPPGHYLTCAECGDLLVFSPHCSALAVLTLHWMEKHRDKYLAMHPESAPHLPG